MSLKTLNMITLGSMAQGLTSLYEWEKRVTYVLALLGNNSMRERGRLTYFLCYVSNEGESRATQFMMLPMEEIWNKKIVACSAQGLGFLFALMGKGGRLGCSFFLTYFSCPITFNYHYFVIGYFGKLAASIGPWQLQNKLYYF
jgi:hypothetical protein